MKFMIANDVLVATGDTVWFVDEGNPKIHKVEINDVSRSLIAVKFVDIGHTAHIDPERLFKTQDEARTRLVQILTDKLKANEDERKQLNRQRDALLRVIG